MSRARLLATVLGIGVALVSARAAAQPEPAPHAPPPSASTASQPHARPRATPEQLNEEAHEAYAAGRYLDAIAKLEAAVALDPSGRELYYNLGLIYEIVGNPDAALLNYQKSLELERAPMERDNLKRSIERLHRAKQAAQSLPAPRPVEPAPPRDGGERAACDDCVWLMGFGAVTAVGLVSGLAFAGAAAAVDPGDHVLTGPGLSFDQARRRASLAHGLGVAADVGFAIAGAGLAAFGIAAAIVLPPLVADDAPASDERAAEAELRIGAGPAAALEVRW